MRAADKAKARTISDLPKSALLKLASVLEHVPVSRATWFRGVKSGIFPQPIKLGSLTFWHASDIRELIDHGIQRAAAEKRRPTRPH